MVMMVMLMIMGMVVMMMMIIHGTLIKLLDLTLTVYEVGLLLLRFCR